jgi:phosphatidylserine/phosphatidylglycerophosphate/cardiolipin synthase-like enzyme
VATVADAQKWFLQWSTTTWGLATQDGRPWGDGTEFVAQRIPPSGPALDPWDQGCDVTPLIGGYETMCAIRDTLEDAITAAKSSGKPDGQKGHVYIAGWRLNPLRDLSDDNPWITSPWATTQTAKHDQTVIGYLLRLMQAGVNVRILVWLPVKATEFADLGVHASDHYFLASVAQHESMFEHDLTRGLVGLDARVAHPLSATHHQKMIVVRVDGLAPVAFCGGVDLAFTRRDAPINPNPADPATHYKFDENRLEDVTAPAPQFLDGDWESGNAIPQQWTGAGARWPQETGTGATKYAAVFSTGRPGQPPSDLPETVYGGTNHRWHDQHLRLHGPIVATLEGQFIDRWKDSGGCYTIDATGGFNVHDNQTIFSGSAAYSGDVPIDLDPVTAVPSAGGSTFVQMWRTMPLRARKAGSRLQRGEFTVMAGLSNAIAKASELIWLFDQYFFSRPTARLLNRVVLQPGSTVQIIAVLPPHADSFPLHVHHARKLALNDLVADLVPGAAAGTFQPPSPVGAGGRIAIFDTWRKPKVGEDPSDPGVGIYVHAKAKMFDDKLLVCGSANINRRSHTCDTELDCAVLDEATLDVHQQRLWKTLFPSSGWPATVVRSQPGWGAAFFDAFAGAAAASDSNLIPDPWNTEPAPTVTKTDATHAQVAVSPPTLPNGVKREQDYALDFSTQVSSVLGLAAVTQMNIILTGQNEPEGSTGVNLAATAGGGLLQVVDPIALRPDVETATAAGQNDPGHPGSLDEVVYLIEAVAGSRGDFPWRRAG